VTTSVHWIPTRRRRWAPAAAVAVVHAVGAALFAIAMAHPGPHGLTAVTALTAYLLGVRHAVDTDHIVAIDNTTRLLREQRQPAATVGLWFALGHSSVVLIACSLFAVGWRPSADATTSLGQWGPLFSGTFLLAIALINARILRDLWGFRHNPQAAQRTLAARGFVSRILGHNWALIRRPSQMLLVGFLFGLGFDTATSVGLLLLSAGASQPAYAFVALPLIFAAGMTLVDSVDGVAMNRAYSWADSDARRYRYNVTVTAISVVAALSIGALTLGRLMPDVG
jgi:high-affinity nickel-transport protein